MLDHHPIHRISQLGLSLPFGVRLPPLAKAEETMKNTVKQLAEIAVPEDGLVVAAIFKVEGKSKPIKVYFQTAFLQPILQQLFGAMKFAEMKSNLAIQGVQSFEEPAQTGANSTENGDTVVVSFRLRNGFEFHYALPASHAKEFAKKIDAAVRGETPLAH
jgi:predicted transcriptional regulator